ncbi:MAG: hypothetical protein RRB13_00105 [bacterium]|nr:hypothetical protein [bacterium]
MGAKTFFIGLSAGLAAGYAAQIMVTKNQEELIAMLKGLPKTKLGQGVSLDELLSHKDKLEDLIRQKTEEIKRFAKEHSHRGGNDDDSAEAV